MIGNDRINGCREYTCDDEECSAVAHFKTMMKPGKVVGAWRIGGTSVIARNVRRNIKT